MSKLRYFSISRKISDRDKGPTMLTSKWKKWLAENDLMLLHSSAPNRSFGTKRWFFAAPLLWISHDFNSTHSTNKNRRTLIYWLVIRAGLMKDALSDVEFGVWEEEGVRVWSIFKWNCGKQLRNCTITPHLFCTYASTDRRFITVFGGNAGGVLLLLW